MNYMQKMKQYRFEHHLKQEDIAKRLGIAQQTYSTIERGGQIPKMDFIELYRKTTGVELMDVDGHGSKDGESVAISLRKFNQLVDSCERHERRLDEVKNELNRVKRRLNDLEKRRLKKAMR